MRRRKARGQLWVFVYLAIRRTFDLFLLSFLSEYSKDVELLALCHEVDALRRQVGFSLAKRTTICTVPVGIFGRPEGFG
jgi:hypothetical protein